jgi:tRNA(fMet)-specific endonuclease VapC
MRYLLDTDTCIYLINRRPDHERILRRIAGKAYGEVLISTITLAELRFGIARSQQTSRNRTRLELFLARFETAPFDEAAAAVYGPLRAELQARGTPIGPLDMLIAAHALSLKATLVSNNVREFSRVTGLMLENWTQRIPGAADQSDESS